MPIDFETCFGFQHCVSTQSKLKISSISFVKTLTLTVFQGKRYAKNNMKIILNKVHLKKLKKNLMEQKACTLKKKLFLKKNHKSFKMLWHFVRNTGALRCIIHLSINLGFHYGKSYGIVRSFFNSSLSGHALYVPTTYEHRHKRKNTKSFVNTSGVTTH